MEEQTNDHEKYSTCDLLVITKKQHFEDIGNEMSAVD